MYSVCTVYVQCMYSAEQHCFLLLFAFSNSYKCLLETKRSMLYCSVTTSSIVASKPGFYWDTPFQKVSSELIA